MWGTCLNETGKPTARIGKTDAHLITSDAMDSITDEPPGFWADVSEFYPSGEAPKWSVPKKLEMRDVQAAYEEILEGAHDPANSGTSARIGASPVFIVHTSLLRCFWTDRGTKWLGHWAEDVDFDDYGMYSGEAP